MAVTLSRSYASFKFITQSCKQKVNWGYHQRVEHLSHHLFGTKATLFEAVQRTHLETWNSNRAWPGYAVLQFTIKPLHADSKTLLDVLWIITTGSKRRFWGSWGKLLFQETEMGTKKHRESVFSQTDNAFLNTPTMQNFSFSRISFF